MNEKKYQGHLSKAEAELQKPTQSYITDERIRHSMDRLPWPVYGEKATDDYGYIKRPYGAAFYHVLPKQFRGASLLEFNRIKSLSEDAVVQRIQSAPQDRRGTFDVMSNRDYVAQVASLASKSVYTGLPHPDADTSSRQLLISEDQERGIFELPGDAYSPLFFSQLEKEMHFHNAASKNVKYFFLV